MSGFDSNQLMIGIIGSLIAAGIAYVIARLSLLSSVRVPIWVIAIFLSFLVFLGYFEYQRRDPNLATVYNKNFGVERIIVDGKEFVDCKFDRSELVFLGTKSFSMIRSKGTNVRFSFEGNSALTITVMQKIYADPGMRRYIEEVIKRITKTE